MGRTASAEPQCLYKGAVYLLPPPSLEAGLLSFKVLFPIYTVIMTLDLRNKKILSFKH